MEGLFFWANRVDSAKRICNSECSFDWIAPPRPAHLVSINTIQTRSDWQIRLYLLKKIDPVWLQYLYHWFYCMQLVQSFQVPALLPLFKRTSLYELEQWQQSWNSETQMERCPMVVIQIKWPGAVAQVWALVRDVQVRTFYNKLCYFKVKYKCCHSLLNISIECVEFRKEVKLKLQDHLNSVQPLKNVAHPSKYYAEQKGKQLM